MPYISPPTNPGDMAGALGRIGSAMFPDPSRMAAAQYQGAHARKAEAETSALNAQNIAKQSVGQALAAAVANPSQETIGSAVSTALQAGYDPAQVVRGALAAHQAAGSPGGPQMAQTLVDTIATTASGGNFASTPTGQGRALDTDIKRAQIAAGPEYARVGVEQQRVANSPDQMFYDPGTNSYQRVPLGQNPGPGMLPSATQQAYGQQSIASRANIMEQDRKNDEPQVFNNGAGQTFSRQMGGPMPPAGFMPAQQGGPLLSTIMSTPPRTGVVPDTTGASNSGFTTQSIPPGGTPPQGWVPIDPQSPQNTIGNAALFGGGGQAQPQAQPALPTAQAAPSGKGLGALIAPAGGPPPAPAPVPPTAAPSAPPDAGGATAAQAPPPNDKTKPLANRLMSGIPVGNPEMVKPGEHAAITAQIKASMKAWNEGHNRGFGKVSSDYALDEDANGRIYERAAQLARTPQTSTFANYPAAVQQALTEFAPQFQAHGNWNLPGSSPATISLPPAQQQGGGTGPVPSAGSPSSAPMGTTPTHQEPVPAPGNVARSGPSSPLSSTIAPDPARPGGVSRWAYPGGVVPPGQVAPAGAQVAQAAPQQTPPPAPPSPAARAVGMVYTVPNGQQLMWTGQGWTK